MKYLLSSIICLFGFNVCAKQIRIAVVDSGYNTSNYTFKLCSRVEQYDMTNSSMYDLIGHGNNVSHIIGDRLKDVDYCIVPIKVFSEKYTPNSFQNVIRALRLVNHLDVDIVNLSFTGDTYDFEEKELIMQLINKNIIVVAAAGNESLNLDTVCNVFPICYSTKIIAVGNGFGETRHAISSNYGKYVGYWADGNKVTAGGVTMTGSSQSTAIVTSQFARQLALIRSRIGK